MAPKLYPIGEVREFEGDGPLGKVVNVKGTQIGLYHFQGKFYAYEDLCAHQGGPACEGGIFQDPDKQFKLACPWHGVEYDIKTGICSANREMKLRPFKVVLKNGIIMLKA